MHSQSGRCRVRRRPGVACGHDPSHARLQGLDVCERRSNQSHALFGCGLETVRVRGQANLTIGGFILAGVSAAPVWMSVLLESAPDRKGCIMGNVGGFDYVEYERAIASDKSPFLGVLKPNDDEKDTSRSRYEFTILEGEIKAERSTKHSSCARTALKRLF